MHCCVAGGREQLYQEEHLVFTKSLNTEAKGGCRGACVTNTRVSALFLVIGDDTEFRMYLLCD